MAIHKVPQNVEAEDKLIGFLSLKQFIFVVVGLAFGYLTFFFFTRVHPVAALIWVPITVVCLVLGLYQRKDQPAEVYLASALKFYLKPHKRIWNQDGYEERVVVTAPPKVEKHYTKDYSQEEVSSHLGSLSRMMDSRGWASRMITDWQNPQLATAASSERLMQPAEVAPVPGSQPLTTQPVDVMDETSSRVAQDFEDKIQQADTSTHQQALRSLQQARDSVHDATSAQPLPEVHYQRYPEMRQKVVQPEQPTTPDASASLANKPATADTPTPSTESVEPPLEKPAVAEPVEPPTPPVEEGEVEIKLH